MRITRSVTLALLFAAAGCVETPAQPGLDELLATAYSGASGCYAVDFTTHVTGVFPFFDGTVSGDLEGLATVVFDPASAVGSGVTSQVDGFGVWEITGGAIPELVGGTFETWTFARNLFSPDNDPLVFEINGGDRAKAGVAKANLTYRGYFDAQDLTPPFDVHLQWHGVICP